MSIQRQSLVWIYTVIAVIALVGTWGNNLQYGALGLDPLATNVHFWKETFVNPASRSITVDIVWLALPATVWMVMEARRLKIGGVWWYLVLSLLVAVSVTFPLFMAARERKLIAAGEPVAGTLTTAELLWLALVTALSLAYTVAALR